MILTTYKGITADLNKPCSICRDDFTAGELGVMAHPEEGLLHPVHRKCIAEWAKAHGTCPSCRTNITYVPSIFLGIRNIIHDLGIPRNIIYGLIGVSTVINTAVVFNTFGKERSFSFCGEELWSESLKAVAKSTMFVSASIFLTGNFVALNESMGLRLKWPGIAAAAYAACSLPSFVAYPILRCFGAG